MALGWTLSTVTGLSQPKDMGPEKSQIIDLGAALSQLNDFDPDAEAMAVELLVENRFNDSGPVSLSHSDCFASTFSSKTSEWMEENGNMGDKMSKETDFGDGRSRDEWLVEREEVLFKESDGRTGDGGSEDKLSTEKDDLLIERDDGSWYELLNERNDWCEDELLMETKDWSSVEVLKEREDLSGDVWIIERFGDDSLVLMVFRSEKRLSEDDSIILTASRSEDKLSVVADSEDDLQKMTEVWSGNAAWLENDAGPGGRDVGRGGELWINREAGPA